MIAKIIFKMYLQQKSYIHLPAHKNLSQNYIEHMLHNSQNSISTFQGV